MGGYRLGIDISGTFTDLALFDLRGRVRFGKRLTTPDDPPARPPAPATCAEVSESRA